jgi:hypothetical protein
MCFHDDIGEISVRQNATALFRKVEDTPVLQSIDWSVATSPRQVGGGNSCGVYMSLKFAAILKAANEQKLFVVDETSQGYHMECTFETGMSADDFESTGRLHMLESLCRGSVDLDHPAVASLRIRIRGPRHLF